MEIEAIRDQFEEAIEREYYVDFPERKPSDVPCTTADPFAAYIESNGIRCPYCLGESIEGGQVDIEGGSASQEMTCLSCDRSWIDSYTLTDVVALQEDEPSGKPALESKESPS